MIFPGLHLLIGTCALHRILAAIGLGFGLLGNTLGYLQEHSQPTSLSALWSDGDRIGGFYGYNVASMPLSWSQDIVQQVLFANMFQLLISFLYLFYNGLLTRQLVAAEWIRFLYNKKSLRVSSPEGVMQRSSYALSLPYRYAVPLMVACIILHWFISRSVFIVTTNVYSPGADGVRLPEYDASRVAFSSTAILASSTLGSLMLLLLLLNGQRRFPAVPANLPQMSTDSAGIKAMCHRPAGDPDGYLYPLQLAAVENDAISDDGTKVICFSTDIKAEPPVDGTVYWQPVRHETLEKNCHFSILREKWNNLRTWPKSKRHSRKTTHSD